jgi:hypothetical protein
MGGLSKQRGLSSNTSSIIRKLFDIQLFNLTMFQPLYPHEEKNKIVLESCGDR